MSRKRIKLGRYGEKLAQEYLINAGYEIEDSNYKKRYGEIDILCWENDEFVFVEVKTIKSKFLNSPVESYSTRQQLRLRKIAEQYLADNILKKKPKNIRFDFIGIKVNKKDTEITHLKNVDLCIL